MTVFWYILATWILGIPLAYVGLFIFDASQSTKQQFVETSLNIILMSFFWPLIGTLFLVMGFGFFLMDKLEKYHQKNRELGKQTPDNSWRRWLHSWYDYIHEKKELELK